MNGYPRERLPNKPPERRVSMDGLKNNRKTAKIYLATLFIKIKYVLIAIKIGALKA